MPVSPSTGKAARSGVAACSAKVPNRALTVLAMALLSTARIAVRYLSFERVGRTLGVRCSTGGAAASARIEAGQLARAQSLARAMARAAHRLPGESRCLPQAIALTWILRFAGIPSRLVIAMHRVDRMADHGFHAWVECGDLVVIGACNQSDYHRLSEFEHISDPLLKEAEHLG